MKLFLFFIGITMIFVSCNAPSEKSTKTPAVNQDSINTAQYETELLNKEMALLKDSIEDSKLDEKSLKANYLNERKKRIALEKDYAAETLITDSLTEVIRSKDKSLSMLSEKKQQKQVQNQEIKNLITNLHTAINQLRSEQQEGAVLQYFLPQFSIKHVKIDTDNLGHIAEYNHEDYKKHLKDLSKEKKSRYVIDYIKILDIETKENSFFNALYKLKMSLYENDNRKYTTNTMVSLTGKRIDGELKIASFSLVEFQYK